MNLENIYQEIIRPDLFVKNFHDMYSFRIWAMNGTDVDLEQCLLTFEHYELYEYCSILLEVLNEKQRI